MREGFNEGEGEGGWLGGAHMWRLRGVLLTGCF